MGGGSGEANEPVSQQHHHVAGDGGHALISRRGLQSDPNGKGTQMAKTQLGELQPTLGYRHLSLISKVSRLDASSLASEPTSISVYRLA